MNRQSSFWSVFFFFCLLSLSAPAQEVAIPYGANKAVGKYYDIRGFKMYCEIYGSGAPLLLIHGNNGSIKSFTQNIPYFSQKYKVIVADSRAQGNSQDSGETLTFEMMADDYAALLDALHIDSAYVIGHSDGGINALLLAIRHPEKVIKLAASGANLSPDATSFIPGFWDQEKKRYEAGKNQIRDTEKKKNNWKLFMLDWSQPHISLKELHSIRCPSLIICGDHDLIPIEHTLQIYRNIPHAALWVIPHSSHATASEHAATFNHDVDEFFSKPFTPWK